MRITRPIGALVCFCVLAFAGKRASTTSGKALGRPDAPIRIELFSDYQCPACRVLHEQTIRPLVTDYVDSGKVYLVTREFPLPMHAKAREAACYACAADKISKYQQVADQLFATQAKWSIDGNVVGPACSVLTPSEATRVIGLARGPEISKIVDDDIRAGKSANIDATPTMIVTRLFRRYPFVGHVNYSLLRKLLDSWLN